MPDQLIEYGMPSHRPGEHPVTAGFTADFVDALQAFLPMC